jgi:small subunit ribosomal protein S18
MAERKREGKSGRRPRGRRDDDGGFRRRAPRLEGVKAIDVNDHEFLRQFVTEHGKIIPARLTGASAKQQRAIKRGIRRCRVMGLLP